MAEKGLFEGLFDKAADVSQDVWDNMSTLDRMALLSAPLPVIGDIIGAVADGVAIAKDPSAMNIALGAAGLLPFVPGGSVTRTMRQALAQAPNDLPGFYEGGFKTAVAVGGGALRGARNLVEARYSPTARGLFQEQGVSVADTRAARQAMKEFSDPNVGTQAGKKVTGQFRQSMLFGQQYKDPSKFQKISEGASEVAFADRFGAKEYYDIMEGATSLTRKDLNSVFDEIKKVQKVNPNKKYQMTVRRPHTQAAGNLNRYVYSGRIFGGETLAGLRKIFDGKPFKTNKEFLDALKNKGIGVRNPEEVLKGRPAIVTGSVKSDARELGGINYMTAIKKEGTLSSFMNDEHDLFIMKAPKADRMLSVSTPIVVDILQKGEKSDLIKKSKDKELLKAIKNEPSLRASKQTRAKQIQQELAKYPGVDTSLKTPPGMTREQFYAVQAVAKMKPSKRDYSRISKEAGLFTPLRAAKVTVRQEEEQQ